MGTPFISEIRIISFNYPPKGWAFCNGQLLPINQNQALFSLMGTTYGGDGVTDFALPNLQGRVPVHVGSGFAQGQFGGEVDVTVTATEMPAHSHQAQAVSTVATSGSPGGNTWASSADDPYNANANLGTVAMNVASVTAQGGSQPHDNMPPYLVLNYIIALQGIFPSRN